MVDEHILKTYSHFVELKISSIVSCLEEQKLEQTVIDTIKMAGEICT